jgi:Xaa-Pro dipeptidase
VPTADTAERAERLAGLLAVMRRGDVGLVLLSRPELTARFAGARRLWTAGAQPFSPSCAVVAVTGEVHVIGFNDACVPEDIPATHRHSTCWTAPTLVDELCAIPGVRAGMVVAIDGLTLTLHRALRERMDDVQLVDALQLIDAMTG